MKHAHQLLVAFALGPLTAFAATEFDGDIPAEVFRQVVGSIFGAPPRLYSDLPDSFPPFEMPRDMRLVASVDQGYTQRVILKSGFDTQAALALAYGALLDAGHADAANRLHQSVSASAANTAVP